MAAAAPLRAPAFYRQATVEDEESPRMINVTFDADVIAYQPTAGNHGEKPGIFISGKNLRWAFKYSILLLFLGRYQFTHKRSH